jgi:hypothetical protein
MDEKSLKFYLFIIKSIDIDSFKSIKNSSIRGLMGSYHMGLGGYLICPEGYVMTNEEMTSLIYLSRVCSCWLFLRMGEGDGIYLQLLHVFFLIGNGKMDLPIRK